MADITVETSHKSHTRAGLGTVRSLLINLLVAGSALYSLGMVGYFVLRLLVGERSSFVALLGSLMPPALLPALPLQLLLLAAGRRRAALLLLPSTFWLVFQYAPFFLPRGAAAPEGAPQLRVVSLNLGGRVADFTVLVDLLRATDADVIALQEFSQLSSDTLAQALAADYPHQARNPGNRFAHGVGLFSRYPILDDFYYEEFELGSQRTRLDFNGTPITIYNAHPISPQTRGGFDATRRSAEIAVLLADAAQESDPMLLVGDFNATDQSEDYHRIRASYGDAFRAVGWGLGPTFPNFSYYRRMAFLPPVIRIDYAFYTPHWQPLEARVLPSSAGSDHFPLLVSLALLP